VSVPRCYVPNASGGIVDLPTEEAHHVARVLRLTVGAAVVVFDGRGQEWMARLSAVDRRRVAIELGESRVPIPESTLAVTLAVALLKGDQMNGVVRDATALGVAAIQPFVSAYVAVPERAWRARSLDRWRRIAIASAKQCGRARLPEILDIISFPEVLEHASTGRAILCVEPGLAATPDASLTRPDNADRVTVCVGPEGGWASAEIQLARENQAQMLSLGPRTLRAELAPTVALAALWTRWGW
jgi:16S rRNA (uracil1498-N3)-methyltransferase